MIVKQWLKTSIPREKILLGMSSYGRSFAVKEDEKNLCNSSRLPIKSIGEDFDFTHLEGFLGMILNSYFLFSFQVIIF